MPADSKTYGPASRLSQQPAFGHADNATYHQTNESADTAAKWTADRAPHGTTITAADCAAKRCTDSAAHKIADRTAVAPTFCAPIFVAIASANGATERSPELAANSTAHGAADGPS